jgi:hypothetical protein
MAIKTNVDAELNEIEEDVSAEAVLDRIENVQAPGELNRTPE